VNVLVVDDMQDVADSFAEMLGLFGHTVRVAYGGQEALSEIAWWKPDAVLLDINMPVLDGIEVAHMLRENCADGLRLVAHSAFPRSTIVRNVEEAGFDGFLSKSASPLQLANAIQGGRGAHDLRTGRRERRMVPRSRCSERRATGARSRTGGRIDR
jgi:CheY-like chemotaxis protein